MSEDIKILIKEKSDKGVLRLVMNNLDYKNAELVFDMFLEITKEIKTAIILVTHDNKLAKKMGKIYQLTEGKIQTR